MWPQGGTNNKLGTGFIVLGRMQSRAIKWQAFSDTLCLLRIKGRFYNYTILNAYCPLEGRPDIKKETFYAQLGELYDSCSRRDIKIVIGDMNAQVGRENIYKPVISPHSLHTVTNDNGQGCVNFAASRRLAVQRTCFHQKDIHETTWRSPDQRTTNQIDHVLIDGTLVGVLA